MISVLNIQSQKTEPNRYSLFKDLISGRVTYQLQTSARNALKASRYIEPRLQHTHITAHLLWNRVMLYCKLSSSDHTNVGHVIQCSIHKGLTIRIPGQTDIKRDTKTPPKTEGLHNFLWSKNSRTNIANTFCVLFEAFCILVKCQKRVSAQAEWGWKDIKLHLILHTW